MQYKRYSEAFKLSVIREIVDGKWHGPLQASIAYRVSWGAIARWMEQYGHGHLLRRVIRVETKDEQDEVKRLKAEVRKLKEALADAHVDLKLSKAFFDIVCEKQRLDPEVVKKNIAGKLGVEVPEKERKKGS